MIKTAQSCKINHVSEPLIINGQVHYVYYTLYRVEKVIKTEHFNQPTAKK